MILVEIDAAIEKARDGILKYLKLMDMLNRVDVSKDADFQRRYNAFYRVQRRPVAWYRQYYSLMQRLKGQNPEFGEVLEEIYKETGRYEPSFASKLVATIDPAKPVWDVHVLRNTGLTAPSYANKNKLALAKQAYAAMELWYAHFLVSPEGFLCLNEFDQKVVNPHRFTPIKKVDFILWQHRTP